MPSLSAKATRASSRLILVVSILVTFASGNAYAFSLLSWFPSEGNFALGEWQGAVIGGYEWEDQQTTQGGRTSSFLRNRFDEEVDLRNDGFYLLDPRLLIFNAGTALDFYQESDKLNGVNQHQDGTLIGWDVDATLLGEMPYSATFLSHQNQANNSTLFGGQTESLNQNFGMIAKLREDSFLRDVLPYFKADVYARQEESDETTTQLGQTFKLNETRDLAGFDADKGFQTGDLDLSYQFINDSYAGSIPFSFVSNWATFDYSLDFGPTLNRRWDSRVSYLTRSGSGVSESFLYADERLHIDHFDNLSTDYEYLFVNTDTQGQENTSNTATFQLRYRPYQNLINTFILQGSYTAITQGHTDFGAVELNSTYNHPIPWGGTFTLGGDGRYELDQDHVTGPITVLDEKHTAPPFFGPGIGFTLNLPFVITSTIVMYDTRGGARIPTRLGVDYIIAQQGQLTKIVILPTTLVIAPGDPLEVSYSYVAAPSGRYSTTGLSGEVGVGFGWISLSFSHQQSNQSMLSGQGSQYLYSTRQEAGQINLHRGWEFFDARTTALYEIYHTQSPSYGSFDYTMQNYGQYLIFRPGWSTILHVDGNEMLTDYAQSRLHDSELDFEASLDRFFASGNYVTAFAQARQAKETHFPTETDYEAGMRGNFRYGKIFIWPWFSWIERTYSPTKTNDPHIMLKIGREL